MVDIVMGKVENNGALETNIATPHMVIHMSCRCKRGGRGEREREGGREKERGGGKKSS